MKIRRWINRLDSKIFITITSSFIFIYLNQEIYHSFFINIFLIFLWGYLWEHLKEVRDLSKVRDKNQEKIVCSAIWYSLEHQRWFHTPKNIPFWFTIAWLRHSDCFGTANFITLTKVIDHSKVIQWFITSKNRFVSRMEAWEIAKEADQIRDWWHTEWILYSEDLY